MDEQFATEAVEALLHAEKAEALGWFVGFRIETRAVIGDAETEGARILVELNESAEGAAVFLDVANRFLGHTEETEGGILGRLVLQALMVKLDFHGVASGKILAEIREGGHETEKLDLRRMQTTRHVVDVGSDFAGGLHE